MARAAWLAGLAAVVALHLWLYLGRFDEAALFNVDVERDLTRTWEWLTGGPYPFEGPNVSDTTITLGSLFYLLLALPMQIGPDPLVVRGFFVVMNTLGLVLFAVLLRRRVRPGLALLAAGALMSTNLWFENARQLWHSNLLPLFVAGFLHAIERWLTAPRLRWWLLAVAAAALAVQLHATMVVLPALLAALALARCRDVGWAGFGFGAAVAAVTLLPFTLGLVFGEVQRTDQLDRWLGYTTGGSVADALGYLLWSLVPGFGAPSARGWFGHPVALAAAVVIAALIVIGAALALRRERGLGFGRLLVGAAVAGVAIQWIVFRHEQSTRYLHANAYALVLLAALGAEHLVARARGPWLPRAAAVLTLGGLVAVAFARPAAPGEPGAAYCSLNAQADMARAVVDRLGISHVDVPYRVHGMACRHRASGYRWFYRARPQDPTRALAARARDVHAFIMPADLPLRPAAAEVAGEEIVGPSFRAVRVTAYRPLIDYRRLERVSHRLRGAPDALPEAGRRAPGAGEGARIEHLRFPVAAGADVIHLRFWQRPGPECPIDVSHAGAPVAPEPVEAASQGGNRLYRLPLGARPGLTEVRVGPCPDLDAVEVF